MPQAIPAIAAFAGGALISMWSNKKNNDIADKQFAQQQALAQEDYMFQARMGAEMAGAQAEAARMGGQIQADVIMNQGSRDSSLYHQQAEDTRALGQINISHLRMEGTETLRRLMRGNEQVEGAAVARSGAQGVRSGEGTARLYQQELEKENTRQENWTRKSFDTRVRAMTTEVNAGINYYNTMSKNALIGAQEAAGAAMAQAEIQAGVYSAQAEMYNAQYNRYTSPKPQAQPQAQASSSRGPNIYFKTNSRGQQIDRRGNVIFSDS